MVSRFDDWFASLPRWLQTAGADVSACMPPLGAAEVKRLADLCVSEAEGKTTGFSALPKGVFETPPVGAQLRIRQINAIRGVNALDTSAALDFGDASLSIIYGPNGTGKSAFARLAKHAAGARTRTELLPDVFSDLAPPASAKFVIERGQERSTEEWTYAGGALDSLRSVHVFDSEVAGHYMTSRAEASYEPRRLRFLSHLVEVCDQVRAELEARKGLLPTRMPSTPSDYASTRIAAHVRGLTPDCDSDAIAKRLFFSTEHSDREKVLETALQTPDPATRVTDLARQTAALRATLQMVKNFTGGLDHDKIVEVTRARNEARGARAAATMAANAVFEDASIPGVGEAAWRTMWEAARTYSAQIASPETPFPHLHEGTPCPLCQQPLDPSTLERLDRFEAFVKGEVEERARTFEEAYRLAVESLPVVPAQADWMAHFAIIPDAEGVALAAHSAATATRAALTDAMKSCEAPECDSSGLLGVITARISALQVEEELLVQAQQGDERQKMEAERCELRALAWFSENVEAIVEELRRKKILATLEVAIRKTNTAGLTKKKAELARDELTGGYQARFARELKALGAERIRVKPVEALNAKGKAKSEKGRVEFELSMTGARRLAAPGKVLSEGEARVVSLAAFFADVSVAETRTPFIFDDPISSLDQDFEELVVARLLDLARTRQVLVFTHRLSLLGLLREAAKKDKEVAKITDGAKPLEVREFVLRRLGDRVGLVRDTSLHEIRVDKALNDLINRRLVGAGKQKEAGQVEEFESTMKSICSDIRILAERAVEEVLLNEVVVRFRRSIITKDKLTPLAKIEVADCTFLDGIMTRFSCFEHSQPAELPPRLPELDDVHREATDLLGWIERFRNRSLPQPAAVSLPRSQ